MTYDLTPAERISILTGRIMHLYGGSGDYTPEQRAAEIADAQPCLREAFADKGIPMNGRALG